MAIPPSQAEVAALLARLTGGAPIETHVSAVYVGRDAALKLKKAVRLDFLDFSTLAARRRFCCRELTLNRAFAPDLYRDVVPVRRDAAGALVLGAPLPPDDAEAAPPAGAADGALDWVLRMAPVPPGDFLDAMAARGALDAALLDALGDAVAAMHAALPPLRDVDVVAAMQAVIAGNARAARAAALPGQRCDDWLAAARAACARLAPLLAARAAKGRVRRCHGDLHLGNLCLWQGKPTPFDALEFDEDYARIDTGYDLAFLLMDLARRPGRAAANRVLNRYLARTGDAGMLPALPLWLSVRAMVRAHVEGARGDGAAALRYLDAADSYLRPLPALVVAVGGLQGTGKSRLARALAPALGAAPGALLLRTDEIRKRRQGVAPEERLPDTAYAEAESAAVYAEFFAAAREAARAGHAVVADAVFLDPAHRAGIAEAARAAGVPFVGFWLEAPLDVLRRRITARRNDASDATVAVLERAARRDPGPMADWIRLDASEDPLPAARKALAKSLTPLC
ncbi:AAA family ATPase [Roseomonas sp. NAR14]|uniref:AAA family ATPase n=1 Tax=Roseomonas acroporae TaxID=2937791 RepID=A0A9X1Y9J4_9PROT|nr:AAA family ATPase [Roseomonas acroporae]MCK8784622.1 AAA family ATPase [Roseomonas acroporae]